MQYVPRFKIDVYFFLCDSVILQTMDAELNMKQCVEIHFFPKNAHLLCDIQATSIISL